MQVQISYLAHYKEYLTAVGNWSYEITKRLDPRVTIKGQINAYAKKCNVNSIPLTLIALKDNQTLIGACTLENEGICKNLSPWISLLYVAPAYRNQKVGEQLISAIKDKAKNLGYSAVYASVFTEKQEQYFHKLGWTLLRKEQYKNHPISINEIVLN